MERLHTHGSIYAGSQWQESTLVKDSTTAMIGEGRRTPKVAYRLVCDAGYYGRRCTLSCSPRHDKFGHYVCSDNGTRVCLDGWNGSFCDVRAYMTRINRLWCHVWYQQCRANGGDVMFPPMAMSNQIKFIWKHKILEKTQVISKTLNKWEQQIQTGVLAGLIGRELL